MNKWLMLIKSKMAVIGGIVVLVLGFLAKLKFTEKQRDRAEDERDRAEAGRDQAVSNERISRETRSEREDAKKQAEKDIADGKVPDSLGGGINDWD